MFAPVLTGLNRIVMDVPATPDAQEAREAAKAELSKPMYDEHLSPIQRLLQWIAAHLDPRTMVPGAPGWLSVLIVAIALAVLAIALYVLLRRLSFSRSRRRRSPLLFDDARDASQLTLAANTAAQGGDWAVAVVERFRAIIRSLDERGLITDYPGMTAHEAADLASTVLPPLGSELSKAAALFDAVRYGEVVASETQDHWMRRLAARVAETSPAASSPSSLPHGSVPLRSRKGQA